MKAKWNKAKGKGKKKRWNWCQKVYGFYDDDDDDGRSHCYRWPRLPVRFLPFCFSLYRTRFVLMNGFPIIFSLCSFGQFFLCVHFPSFSPSTWHGALSSVDESKQRRWRYFLCCFYSPVFLRPKSPRKKKYHRRCWYAFVNVFNGIWRYVAGPTIMLIMLSFNLARFGENWRRLVGWWWREMKMTLSSRPMRKKSEILYIEIYCDAVCCAPIPG